MINKKLTLVGKSPHIKEVKNLIKIASQFHSPVIITGETGVGKDLIAQIIHANSNLSGEFVAMNCGAIHNDLLVAELFGSEKGSYTGSTGLRKGYFELADKGTLFLDEIGETSLEFQVKLLRVLEDGYLYRVGSQAKVEFSARFIAGTNADLATLIKEKKFRSDLFYRLFGLSIHIKPLRERKEDIVPLCDFFLESMEEKYPELLIKDDAAEKIGKHDWPGNVRELFAVLNFAIMLAKGKSILQEHIRFPLLN